MNICEPEKKSRSPKKNLETEVFGVTYDRYILLRLHTILVQNHSIKTVLEMPSHGAKAAGSLYSIGFGLAGCNVTLANPEMEMMYGWDELGIRGRVEPVENIDIYNTDFKDNQFDMAWNFVTWTELSHPLIYLREMKRVANKHILLITCNNFQPGYPWHRLIHKVFGFQWTHGQVKYNRLSAVKNLFRRSGIDIVEYGAIDTPGWPDPSGPRDIRLHKRFGSGSSGIPAEKPQWEVRFIQYARTGQYPQWMRALGRWDMAFRKGIFKLPMSHLFYVLGETGKNHDMARASIKM